MKILPFPVDVAPGVAELAEQKLKASPYYFLRRITCEFSGGALTLRGRVPMRGLLPVAEAIVANLDGVVEVINCLEVGSPLRVAQAARNAG